MTSASALPPLAQSLARAEIFLPRARESLRVRKQSLAGRDPDVEQVAAYKLAWSAAELAAAEALTEYAKTRVRAGRGLPGHPDPSPHPGLGGALEAAMAALLAAEVAGEELPPSEYEAVGAAVLAAGHGGLPGDDEDHALMRDTFRRFAEEHVAPLAEKVHRQDLLIPEDLIAGLAELGCFGLSIPERFGGFQSDAKPDNLGMIVVTEELSRASLGVAGSLITRPEILAKALLAGGTEEQKARILPVIAAGEKMVAVCVTEPDFGSDVAGLKFTATPAAGQGGPVQGGRAGWKLNGVKTWATFAGRAEYLMVLARTDPDSKKKHKGLSVFVVEKPPFEGHEFAYDAPDHGGRMEGRAIPTIGYRGMHSFEVSFQDFFVPAENLVGGDAGLGKGFYFQMEGFAGGRLQTAARAVGVMQSALEAAIRYTSERRVFGRTIGSFQLARWKLARMAMLTQASRQLAYSTARLVDQGKGSMESSLTKLYASRVAEWVTREAQQLHGGMGYAEEFTVSRYFVDARVFSIFEGAEEVLALKVVARALLEGK